MVYSIRGGNFPGANGEDVAYYDRDILEPAKFNHRHIKIANFSETMVPGIGPIGEYYASGFRVSTEYLPTKIRYDDKRPPLDFDHFEALEFVSPSARSLIERFEPGIHQLEPVEYVRSSGEHVADMFLLFVCRRLDVMDRERTNMFLSPHYWVSAKDMLRRKPEEVTPGADLEAKSRMVFNLRQIGDAHLWRDRHIAHAIFASDTLVRAIKSAGLTGLGAGLKEAVD